MHRVIRVVAGLAFAAALPWTASAQDYGTMQVGNAEISVGGGATLSLPDIHFGILQQNGTTRRLSNDSNFGDQFGPSITAGIVAPWSGPIAFAVTGFFSNIDDDQTAHCSSNASGCFLVDPANGFQSNAPQIKEHTSRDVNNWGVQAEARYYLNGPIVAPGLLKSSYVAAGADVRAIEQDTSINSLSPQFSNSPIRYDENLDTHYYGGYLAIGGEYTLFPNLAAAWGFRSFFNAHIGVYDANTDYSGAYKANFAGDSSRLSLSNDKAAAIAGLRFETRKQIGLRTSLALLSEYEWYSSVAQMRYDNLSDSGTKIDEDSAFATRTTLRLNIGLDPAALYAPPLK